MLVVRQYDTLLVIEGIILFNESIRGVVSHTFFRTYSQYFFAALYLVLKVKSKRWWHFDAFSCVEIDVERLLTLESDVLYFKKFLFWVQDGEGDAFLNFIFFEKWVYDGFGSVVYGLLIRDYIFWSIVFVENLKRIASLVADRESRHKSTGLVQLILAFVIALNLILNDFGKLFYADSIFLGQVDIDLVSHVYFNHTVSLIVFHDVGFQIDCLDERLPTEDLIVEVAYLQREVSWKNLVWSIDILIDFTLA